jgi:hypothetical protein
VSAAAKALAASSADGIFAVEEVVDHLRRRGSGFAESAIRTHVVTRMCSTAPDNHGSVCSDLIRVARGH